MKGPDRTECHPGHRNAKNRKAVDPMVSPPHVACLRHRTYNSPTCHDLVRVTTMRFGNLLRELRKAKGLTLRTLGQKVGVSYAYVSKVETGRLDFGDYPSEDLIRRLAAALDADEEELLLLAKKIPEPIRRRFFERPDAFRQIARLDDKWLDRVLASLSDE